MGRSLYFLLALLLAPMAQAHPHVFVDVGLRLEHNAQGQVVGVEVSWGFDALFSLLVLSDRDLDTDGDMQLTEVERVALKGFDVAHFKPDEDAALFVFLHGRKLDLQPPDPVDVVIEDGRLVARHVRRFEPVAPADLIGLRIQSYDPTYYAAMELTGTMHVPHGCVVNIDKPDRTEANRYLAKLNSFGNEAVFDEVLVGVHFAETLSLTCDAT